MKFGYWWFVFLGMAIYFGIVYFSKYLDQNNLGWFNLYLQIGTITIFLINLILTLDNHHQQTEDRHKSYYIKYANLAQMKLNDIDKMFFSNPMLTRLYFQMYQSDKHIQKIIKQIPPIKDNVEILKAEHHASSIIFQTMADIYMTGLTDRDEKFYCEDLVEWYITFKKWLHSPILRSHWTTLADEHHPKFKKFIDSIILSNTNGTLKANCIIRK